MLWLACFLFAAIPPSLFFALREILKVWKKNELRKRDRARAAEKYARNTALKLEEARAAAALEVETVRAEALVTAARYTSRAIKVTPKATMPGAISIFEKWLSKGGGHRMPETVRDQVEWAMGRLRGIEGDEQGDTTAAETVLAHYAPGYAQMIRDELAATAARADTA